MVECEGSFPNFERKKSVNILAKPGVQLFKQMKVYCVEKKHNIADEIFLEQSAFHLNNHFSKYFNLLKKCLECNI